MTTRVTTGGAPPRPVPQRAPLWPAVAHLLAEVPHVVIRTLVGIVRLRLCVCLQP